MLSTGVSSEQALVEECVRHLQALIRLDTSNPPGNEVIVVEYIRQQLAAVGVEAEVIESEPGRANLRAVLKGDGSERPLLLMSHTDVVPAEAQFWKHEPFSGDIDGGYVWGRGAVDMKQWGAWHLTIFLDLARSRTPLKRDVVLLATADEEDGSYKGMRWIAEHHPDWLEGEYGLSEGGGGELQVRGQSFFPCRVAEKGVCRLRFTAKGTPGHASRPHNDNAIIKLGTALQRLGAMPLPIQRTDAVADMLEPMLAKELNGEQLLEDIFADYTSEIAMDSAPLSKAMRLTLSAQIRNTAAPTILHQAGSRINVIPSEAVVEIDGRLLPGVRAEDFVWQVKQIVGDSVDVEAYEYWPGSASKFDTELFDIMKEVTHELTGGTLVPFMATGASDARFAEPFGVNVYGFGLMRDEPDAAPAMLMHAHDERISLDNVNLGLRALHQVVHRIAAKGE
jgi:acetylornithine deacetylase/succinyl-diaminopimelate desuccinylase-like protein